VFALFGMVCCDAGMDVRQPVIDRASSFQWFSSNSSSSRWQQQKLGPVLIPPPPSAEDVGQNGFQNPYNMGVVSLLVVAAYWLQI